MRCKTRMTKSVSTDAHEYKSVYYKYTKYSNTLQKSYFVTGISIFTTDLTPIGGIWKF